MRSDKKSTCMVKRQRQSIITHNGSEMIMFSIFCECTANRFLEEAPKCSPPSCFRYTVLEAKKTRKFRETALKGHKECHHFEVFDDLPSLAIILQGIQQHLDTGVVLFEMHSEP